MCGVGIFLEMFFFVYVGCINMSFILFFECKIIIVKIDFDVFYKVYWFIVI